MEPKGEQKGNEGRKKPGRRKRKKNRVKGGFLRKEVEKKKKNRGSQKRVGGKVGG